MIFSLFSHYYSHSTPYRLIVLYISNKKIFNVSYKTLCKQYMRSRAFELCSNTNAANQPHCILYQKYTLALILIYFLSF